MRGELLACMWTHKDMGLVRTIARARRLARPRAPDQQAARELRATSSFLDWGTRCVISLVGALRPDNRSICTFTLTTRPCPASGPKRCGFNVPTAELNMKRWWSGSRRSFSRMNPKKNPQGVGAPRGLLGDRKLMEGIMQFLRCRADTRPSDTKIRAVASP
jgi:hypothetical protein